MVLPYPDCENSTNCDGQERNRDSLVYPSYRHKQQGSQTTWVDLKRIGKNKLKGYYNQLWVICFQHSTLS